MRKTWASVGWAELAVVVLVTCCAQQAWAVNKCTAKDGAVVYQDAPCASTLASETLVTRHNTPADAAGRGRQQLPAPQPIQWPGTPDMDVIRSEALLDSMQSQGSDCEWALKVTRGASILAKCVPFMASLQADGLFPQVSQRLQELLRDKDWAATALPSLRRCSRLMEGVVRQKELMLAHLDMR